MGTNACSQGSHQPRAHWPAAASRYSPVGGEDITNGGGKCSGPVWCWCRHRGVHEWSSGGCHLHPDHLPAQEVLGPTQAQEQMAGRETNASPVPAKGTHPQGLLCPCKEHQALQRWLRRTHSPSLPMQRALATSEGWGVQRQPQLQPPPSEHYPQDKTWRGKAPHHSLQTQHLGGWKPGLQWHQHGHSLLAWQHRTPRAAR